MDHDRKNYDKVNKYSGWKVGDYEMEHLMCFVPGMLMLGYHEIDTER